MRTVLNDMRPSRHRQLLVDEFSDPIEQPWDMRTRMMFDPTWNSSMAGFVAPAAGGQRRKLMSALNSAIINAINDLNGMGFLSFAIKFTLSPSGAPIMKASYSILFLGTSFSVSRLFNFDSICHTDC